MAKEIRPLYMTNDSTGVDEIFYPATTTDAIAHPTKRKSLTTVLGEIENGSVYDISAAHNNQPYVDLAAALGTNGANVPQSLRKGGISVKFIQGTVQGSDNKYVQFRYMLDDAATDSKFTNTDNWSFCGNDVYVENPEWIRVILDNDDKILAGIKADGSIEWGLGVPTPVKDYVGKQIAVIMQGSNTTDIDGINKIIAFLEDFSTSDTLKALLDEKVDIEEGKSLIDAEYASAKSTIENPEYLEVTTDSEDRIIEGINTDFVKEIQIPINILNTLIFQKIDNPEWSDVITDPNNRIIFGIKKDGYVYINNIEKIVIDVIPKIENSVIALNQRTEDLESHWKNKSIAWFGTSIPAGDRDKRAYPYITGVNLDARIVYNEAVGSSCARKRVTSNATYGEMQKQMGNSIEDALTICADIWTIDDQNHTFSNGPRLLGITEIPSVSSYSDVCYQRHLFLSNSYEVKLVSRHLISGDENEQYLRSKFGALYNTLIGLNPGYYTYQGDVDLFVFDHGHNDEITSVVPSEDINSKDITTFVGAINTYMGLIQQYRPHTRMVIISDYDNLSAQYKTIEVQSQIAENWHIPFIDLRYTLPFNKNIKVKVRGYWSIDGTWKEEGFIYNPEASSIQSAFAENGDAYFNHFLGNTIQQIATNITPEQDSDNVWWYYIEPRYLWIKDGVHPDSDLSNKCLDFYARILSDFFNNI